MCIGRSIWAATVAFGALGLPLGRSSKFLSRFGRHGEAVSMLQASENDTASDQADTATTYENLWFSVVSEGWSIILQSLQEL